MAATEATPLVNKEEKSRMRQLSWVADSELLKSSDSMGSRPSSLFMKRTMSEPPTGFAANFTIYMTAVAVASNGGLELASQYFLKDTLRLGPAGVSAAMSTHSIGWTMKPLWGLVTDSFPIGGQRRRPYIVIMSLFAALGFISYGVVENVWQFIVVLVLTNACMAFLTVLAQAVLVHRSNEADIRSASFNFSSYFGTKTIAWALIALAAGFMLHHYSPRHVLMSTALVFLVLAASASFMKEGLAVEKLGPIQHLQMLLGMFRLREVWGTSLYIFVFCSMPHPTSAMFFFSVDVLHFSSNFMAVISAATSVAHVFGLMLYHFYLTGVPFRRLFAGATLFCAVISLTPLIQVFRLNRVWGIDDRVFALVDTFIIQVVAEVMWIPMLVLASRLCPGEVGGTTYALFFAIHNFGYSVSGFLSGFLTYALGITEHDLSNLWLLVTICALCTLVPLAFLPLVPNIDPQEMRDSLASKP